MIPLPARALTAATKVLDEGGIEYALSGSLAASFHGYVRATVDADIKVVADAQRLDAVSQRLPLAFRRLDEASWLFEERFTIELYPVRDALDRRAIGTRQRARLFPALNEEYWVVGLECLLILKIREYARHGDPKHVVDIRELLARNEDRLDVKELERLLALNPAWSQAWDESVEPADAAR